MIKQYYLGCLSHASYMVWDAETKKAVVVDPQRDVQQYLDDAKELGVEIEKVVLTHFHADFIAGHLELQKATGATIVMGQKAETEYPIHHAKHGETWEYPTLSIEVLESPGHTPEMINLLITDKTNPEAPKMVLTGDTLFNGDVGRPDLLASRGVTQEELANMLFDSVQMLKALPDETVVYPAHGAGSMCGKSLAAENVTTIGAQKALNYAVKAESREDFVRLVTADQATAPQYFGYDADMNRRNRALLEERLDAVRTVDVDQLLLRANEGAQIVDTRDSSDFCASHLPGSYNIGLDGTYATWCGTVLDHSRPIIVVSDPGAEEESILRLGRIGYDNVEATLDGGFPSLTDREDLLESRQRLDAQQMLDSGSLILDVRGPGEREGSFIPGSLHIPLAELQDRVGELPHDEPIVVHCAGGYRSSLAASILRNHGFKQVSDLAGGIMTYQDAGLPTYTLRDGIQQIPITDMADAMKRMPMIDVREQDEWDAQHIPGAILRPMSQFETWADEFDGQEILVQCRSGNRSQQIALKLQARGVTAHNLAGGILAYQEMNSQ